MLLKFSVVGVLSVSFIGKWLDVVLDLSCSGEVRSCGISVTERGHLACPYCVIVCRYICIVPETTRGSGVQLCNQPAVWDNLLVLLRYMTFHHAMQQQPLFLSYIWKYFFWITFNKSQDCGRTEVIFCCPHFHAGSSFL